MKNTALTILIVFFILSFFIIGMKQENKEKFKETRAIYISYIELNSYIKGKKEEISKQNIIKMLDNIKEINFNTIILHVRPFADSIYKSEYFPISNTIVNEQGTYPNYDILEYIIKEAHIRNLKVEAWINPFRISNLTDKEQIPIDSPYYKFIKNNDAKIIEGKGIFLNPASKEVQELIINGIREVVENYNIDGIHFDDYFYPDDTIDLESYDKYKEKNNNISLEEYRRENILTLIKNTYSSIKKINKNVVFGIAPEGNIENNYNKHYLDIKEILSNEGYIDYIMPQIYYGFENQVKPFIETIEVWDSLITTKNIKLIPALAFYKTGNIDEYAGAGKNEWKINDDIIKKEILIARNKKHYAGFSLFRYEYLFNKEKMNAISIQEKNNMLTVIN